jgi:threonine/homoserine/homoserine lactone efflux protein
MNTIKMPTEMKDGRVILSTLWIFATLNYLYCDVMALMDAKLLKQFMEGNVGGVETTQGFFLGAAILMEIPMAMVLLSRVLKYRANRWANIIAGTIMTVVQFSTLFFGSSPTIYYIFFSIIEIACTLVIVWYAWQWRNPEALKVSANKLALDQGEFGRNA